MRMKWEVLRMNEEHGIVERLIDDLTQSLTDEQRLEVFEAFCVHCGCEQVRNPGAPDCQCWNDE